MEFLIEYGYIGVFIASFLAATILPFSSEVVLTGVLLAGAAYAPCMISATLGNFLGGMSCYWLGMLGKTEWIEKYLKLDPDKLRRVQGLVDGLLRLPARRGRFHRRGPRLPQGQHLDRGCLDVPGQGDPLLGLDGVRL